MLKRIYSHYHNWKLSKVLLYGNTQNYSLKICLMITKCFDTHKRDGTYFPFVLISLVELRMQSCDLKLMVKCTGLHCSFRPNDWDFGCLMF